MSIERPGCWSRREREENPVSYAGSGSSGGGSDSVIKKPTASQRKYRIVLSVRKGFSWCERFERRVFWRGMSELLAFELNGEGSAKEIQEVYGRCD